MKRISILFVCLSLVLLSACKDKIYVSSTESLPNRVSSVVESVSVELTESTVSVESTVIEASSIAESVISVSPPVESTVSEVSSVETVTSVISEVSSKTETVASVISEASSVVQSAESVDTATTSSTAIIEKYTVNDPENTRGLSNEKSGFGFGIAENGVANSLSFSNQAKFDSMANVEALALDTKSADKRMYLTFDCGYEYNNLTAKILDTLKEKNVKAAFFLTLTYIQKNPQLVSRMINEGHIVGNHSATHPSFPDISRSQMAEELFLVDEYLYKSFGYKTKYFRFPAGEHSENSLELVTSLGYKSIFWSSAYRDYDTSAQVGYNEAYKTVTDRFHQGAVILLHAVSQDNADILGAVIDNAHSQGYVFKTLDDYYTN